MNFILLISKGETMRQNLTDSRTAKAWGRLVAGIKVASLGLVLFYASVPIKADTFSASVPGQTVSGSSTPLSLTFADTFSPAGLCSSGLVIIGLGSSASASAGQVGGSSSASVSAPDGCIPAGGPSSTSESSSFMITGITVSAPAGASPFQSVPFTVDLAALSGSFGAIASNSNYSSGLTASVSGACFSQGFDFLDFSGNFPNLGTLSLDSNGNLTQSGIFTPGPFSFGPNVPGAQGQCQTSPGADISLTLTLNTSATAFGPFSQGTGGTAEAAVDFLDPLSFSTSGPVLNLPTGWTVNSTDGLIVNDQFIAPTGVVPEPSTLLLFGTGLFTLIGAVTRKLLGLTS
jgi:PEP-CTERM motif-containing protein